MNDQLNQASYYALLQVDPAADPEVIESAYHRLARKYHPDLNESEQASERMRAINQAYATLGNPGRRAIYDRERRGVGIGQRFWRPAVRPSASPNPVSVVTSSASVERYEAATAPLKDRASTTFRTWANAWSEALEALTSGDGRASERASESARRCLTELTDCLARWEAQVPPPAASRLSELGAGCLRLQLALVRGTLNVSEGADLSALQHLAGLAERINGLTRTIAAEALVVARANA